MTSVQFFKSVANDGAEVDAKTLTHAVRFLTWGLGDATPSIVELTKDALLLIQMWERKDTMSDVTDELRDAAVKDYMEEKCLGMMHNLGKWGDLTDFLDIRQPFMDMYTHVLRCVRSIISILGTLPTTAGGDRSEHPKRRRRDGAAKADDTNEPDTEEDHHPSMLGKFLPRLVAVLKDARVGSSIGASSTTHTHGVPDRSRPSVSELPRAHWTLLKVRTGSHEAAAAWYCI